MSWPARWAVLNLIFVLVPNAELQRLVDRPLDGLWVAVLVLVILFSGEKEGKQ